MLVNNGKFAFCAILETKWREIKVSKPRIFRVDRHISNLFFFIVQILVKIFLYFFLPPPMTSFSRQKLQHLKAVRSQNFPRTDFFKTLTAGKR